MAAKPDEVHAPPDPNPFDEHTRMWADEIVGLPRITAIWLRRIGSDVQVLFESDGTWHLAITEHSDGSFSHIIEQSGLIRTARTNSEASQ